MALTIMSSGSTLLRRRTSSLLGLTALAALLTGLVAGAPARAADPASSGSPAAGPAPAGVAPLSGRACRLLVPASQSELQPLQIKPQQVAEKNARGCLSPADAIYGPDGCPLRLCGRQAGVIQLPEP
jgi:hypothetical protein